MYPLHTCLLNNSRVVSAKMFSKWYLEHTESLPRETSKNCPGICRNLSKDRSQKLTNWKRKLFCPYGNDIRLLIGSDTGWCLSTLLFARLTVYSAVLGTLFHTGRLELFSQSLYTLTDFLSIPSIMMYLYSRQRDTFSDWVIKMHGNSKYLNGTQINQE